MSHKRRLVLVCQIVGTSNLIPRHHPAYTFGVAKGGHLQRASTHAGRVAIKQVAPLARQWGTQAMTTNHTAFVAAALVLAIGLGLAPVGAEAATVYFQHGQDNGYGVYLGVSDTWIDGVPGSTGDNHSADSTLYATGTPYYQQALVRFDDIIGSLPGQVPAGSMILDATLTMTVVDAGDWSGFVSRLLGDWDASTITWDNAMLNGNTLPGLQRDGIEATADVLTAPVYAGLGTIDVDVTDIVQAWVDGAGNYGVFFEGVGSDLLGMASADGRSTPPEPLLAVEYEVPEPGTLMLLTPALLLVRRRR